LWRSKLGLIDVDCESFEQVGTVFALLGVLSGSDRAVAHGGLLLRVPRIVDLATHCKLQRLPHETRGENFDLFGVIADAIKFIRLHA